MSYSNAHFQAVKYAEEELRAHKDCDDHVNESFVAILKNLDGDDAELWFDAIQERYGIELTAEDRENVGHTLRIRVAQHEMKQAPQPVGDVFAGLT